MLRWWKTGTKCARTPPEDNLGAYMRSNYNVL